MNKSRHWKKAVVIGWLVCLGLLGMTSNADKGIQFTAPWVNSMVHCLAYGLSVVLLWWLPRWPGIRVARGMVRTIIFLQWVGLGLMWLLSLATDLPSPFGYFANTGRWQTDQMLYYRGPVKLVQQHLVTWDIALPSLFTIVPADSLSPPDREIPAYPSDRTVLIEPLLPGFQRVSCTYYVSGGGCGCCHWDHKFDASWTLVDTLNAGLQYSSDSATLKPLLARERARNVAQARQRIRARLQAGQRRPAATAPTLSPPTQNGANTLSFVVTGLTVGEPEFTFPQSPVVCRSTSVEAIWYGNASMVVRADFMLAGYSSTLKLDLPAGSVRRPGAVSVTKARVGSDEQPHITLEDNARYIRFQDFYLVKGHYESTAGIRVTITHRDSVAHILSGTFEGQLRAWNGGPAAIQLSKGRFDVHYQDWKPD